MFAFPNPGTSAALLTARNPGAALRVQPPVQHRQRVRFLCRHSSTLVPVCSAEYRRQRLLAEALPDGVMPKAECTASDLLLLACAPLPQDAGRVLRPVIRHTRQDPMHPDQSLSATPDGTVASVHARDRAQRGQDPAHREATAATVASATGPVHRQPAPLLPMARDAAQRSDRRQEPIHPENHAVALGLAVATSPIGMHPLPAASLQPRHASLGQSSVAPTASTSPVYGQERVHRDSAGFSRSSGVATPDKTSLTVGSSETSKFYRDADENSRVSQSDPQPPTPERTGQHGMPPEPHAP